MAISHEQAPYTRSNAKLSSPGMKQLAGRKILFVITKSNWGGAQQYVFTLATRARDAGADVAVVLGGTGEAGASAGLLASRLVRAEIRTIFLKSFMRDISIFSEFKVFAELLQVIRAEKPDVLHVNSSKASGIGALAGRLCGVQNIIFTAHGWPHKEPRPFLFRIMIWLASYATVFLSHSIIVLLRKEYVESPALFFQHRLRIIPNGVGGFPLLERNEARTKLATRDARIAEFSRIIFSTSELHANKGLDILIDAFAPLAALHPDTALVLTHTGEEHDALVAQVAKYALTDQVFILGFMPEARSLLSAADIFVLPSRKEGLPFGLLEAGRAGAPVIASAVGAIPEVVQDNVSGILIPSGDTAALTEAMRRLLNNPAAAKLGQTLRQHIVEHYSEEHMVRETFALYSANKH